jgi:hypothetical protein
MEITFSTHQLLINNLDPSEQLLNIAFQFKPTAEVFNDKEKVYYEIETDVIDNRFYWLSAHYGSSLPRSTTVYNSETKETQENPRQATQAETNKQLFALYDTQNKIFFISNSKKRGTLEEYLFAKIRQPIAIKNFYSDSETFIRTLKTVSQIRLVSKHSLFASTNDIFSESGNVTGLGAPDKLTLEVNYKEASKTDGFVGFLKNKLKEKEEGKIDFLYCAGKGEDGFGVIFNTETFTKKISFETNKNSNGLFIAGEIKAQLMVHIKEKINV